MILSESCFTNTMDEAQIADSLAIHTLDPAFSEPILLAGPAGFELPASVATALAASGRLTRISFSQDGSALLSGAACSDMSQFGEALRLAALESLNGGGGSLLVERLENATPAALDAVACFVLDAERQHFPRALLTCSYGMDLHPSYVAACRKVGVALGDPAEPEHGIHRKPEIRRSR